MRPLTLGTRADLKIDRVALRLIDEMMAVGDPSLETRGVAPLQHGRAAILDQHDLTLEHVNEFVFGLVPVPAGGGGAGPKARQTNPALPSPHTVGRVPGPDGGLARAERFVGVGRVRKRVAAPPSPAPSRPERLIPMSLGVRSSSARSSRTAALRSRRSA